MRIAIVAMAVVVGILGGFYGGYKVGQGNVAAASSTSNNTTQRGTTAGGFAPGRGANGAACPSPGSTPAAGAQALARGTVTNLTATSMTVTNAQCSVTVTFGPTTIVQKQVAGSTSDLANSETVTVSGTRGADGSVKAVAIQIAPAGAINRPGSPSPGGG